MLARYPPQHPYITRNSKLRKLFARLLGFSLLPLLSSLTPLLLLPIVARVGGVEGWASISLGQAIGAFGAAAVGYGWNVSGPPRSAQSKDETERRILYMEAVSVRLFMSLFVIPIVIALTLMVSPLTFGLDAALMAVSMVLVGLSPSWFLIGQSDPKSIAVFETLPKLAATGVAAVCLVLTHVLWLYPLLLIVGSLAGLTAFHRQRFGAWIVPINPLSAQTRRALRSNSSTALVDLTGTTYVAAPLPIIGLTSNTQELAGAASGDKLYRYGLFAVVALANGLQSWVLEADADTRKRLRLSVIAHVSLGLGGCAGLLWIGPAASEWLFGSAVGATNPLVAMYGLAFLFVSTSTPLVRNILLPRQKARLVLRGTISGALFGVVAMIVGGHYFGAPGVAAGFAASEFLVLVIVVLAVMASPSAPSKRAT